MSKLLTGLLCLALSACSSIPMKIWYIDTDTLIKNHDYKKALYQIKNTQPIDTDKIKDVHAKAKKFTRKELKYIQTLLINKQWSKAEQLLGTLSTKVPNSPKITEVKKQLSKLRYHEKLDLTIKVKIAHANLLLAKQSDVEFQLRDQGDPSWYQSNDQLTTDINNTADALFRLSKQSLDIQHIDNAKLALNYAKKLNRDLIIVDLRNTIDEVLLKRKLATIEQNQSQYMTQLKKAINDENFEQIIHLTSALSDNKFKGQNLNSLIEEAKTLLYENAQELNLSADQAYRLGNIKEAIQLWQQAQTLHPQLPGISDKLSRAQKVSNKLDTLRQRQAL